MTTQRKPWLALIALFVMALVTAELAAQTVNLGAPPALPDPLGDTAALRLASPQPELPAQPPALPQTAGDAPWAPDDRRPRKVSSRNDSDWGTLSGSVAVDERDRSARWEDPLWRPTWQADQSWRYDVLTRVYVFGQVGANGAEAGQSDLSFSGRTGLACKLPVWIGEVQVRSGPGVSCTDPTRPALVQERSDWLVEVQARCPLLLGVGLEYQGTALPALTPQAQDQLTQDLRLAMPLGPGKLKLGARRRWTANQGTAYDPGATQLYLGMELAR